MLISRYFLLSKSKICVPFALKKYPGQTPGANNSGRFENNWDPSTRQWTESMDP